MLLDNAESGFVFLETIKFRLDLIKSRLERLFLVICFRQCRLHIAQFLIKLDRATDLP